MASNRRRPLFLQGTFYWATSSFIAALLYRVAGINLLLGIVSTNAGIIAGTMIAYISAYTLEPVKTFIPNR